MLILSLPKYSSAGATRTGASLWTGAGFVFGFSGEAARAAVVVTATNETHASNRFTAILSSAM
jgi:hypothetical protein